eukprot:6195681-Pleurochrysis_carterae.AAC.1
MTSLFCTHTTGQGHSTIASLPTSPPDGALRTMVPCPTSLTWTSPRKLIAFFSNRKNTSLASSTRTFRMVCPSRGSELARASDLTFRSRPVGVRRTQSGGE